MKTHLTAACAIILLASCAGTGSRTEEVTAAEVAEPATKMLCGAYAEQRDLTPEEMELFKSVTAELDGVGYTPQSVATQVVAGTNYRFVCKAVTTTREPQTYQAEVVVFKPLPCKKEAARITSIKKL